jgi:hypothetical protein
LRLRVRAQGWFKWEARSGPILRDSCDTHGMGLNICISGLAHLDVSRLGRQYSFDRSSVGGESHLDGFNIQCFICLTLWNNTSYTSIRSPTRSRCPWSISGDMHYTTLLTTVCTPLPSSPVTLFLDERRIVEGRSVASILGSHRP